MNRPADASSIALPPATEPVKHTMLARPPAMISPTWGWLSTRCWNTPFGSFARSNACWNRSATSSVEAACFSTTVLPAISAGMTELTAVR